MGKCDPSLLEKVSGDVRENRDFDSVTCSVRATMLRTTALFLVAGFHVLVELVQAVQEGASEFSAHLPAGLEVSARLRPVLVDEARSSDHVEEVARRDLCGALRIARFEPCHEVLDFDGQVGDFFRTERGTPRVGTARTAMLACLRPEVGPAAVFRVSEFSFHINTRAPNK